MTAQAKKMSEEEHERMFLALAQKAMAPQRNTWEKAEKLLKVETLLLVNKTSTINRRGRAILERWAVNQPDTLKALETRSQATLLMRLAYHQNLEASILETEAAQEQLRNGLVEHEILEMHGVDMRMNPMPGEMQTRTIA